MTDQYIGNYRVLKKIGAGGMAQVYLGVHKDVPNLKVVLKLLTDPRLVERFKQEADKLALLDGHGNICQIKHFFSHGDDIVIAMEYIDGVTLDDVIKEKGKLPVAESLQIVSDVLQTLQFAHEKGIFHRDIKPSNIMIDRSGRVKIIDFGIAKGKTDPNLTVAGSSCGTPAYMPPEQFNPTEDIDYSLVDVYAIGTTLFKMLTGELPFTGDNQFALRDAKMFNDPPSPRKSNPEVSRRLEEIILKALAKEPEARYASAEEMRRAINSLQEGKKVTDLTESIAPSEFPTPSKTKRGFPKTVALAAAVVIVAALAYWLFFMPSGPAIPKTPVPVSPEAGAVIDGATPVFSWRAVDDGSTAYIVEYAADSGFSAPIEKPIVAATSYTAAAPLPDGRYFWRVQSMDRDGNRSAPSAALPFTIETGVTPPLQGTLEVAVRPRGDIYIDGQPFGQNKSAITATLDTGQHIVRVINAQSIQGELTETVYLSAGESKRIPFRFTFPAAEIRPDSSDVIIGSWPQDGGIIFIDGVLQEQRTNHTFRLPVGKHLIKVVLTLDGEEREQSDTVIVRKGETAKKRFDFQE